MELVYQVAQPPEIDQLYAFADERFKIEELDEATRVLQAWHAPWRREALEYYLPLGWSFLARRKIENEAANMVGFFLGQVILFMGGQTQTLWIDSLEADDRDVGEGLIDLAYRLAREKHLQRVLLPDTGLIREALGQRPYDVLKDQMLELRMGRR